MTLAPALIALVSVVLVVVSAVATVRANEGHAVPLWKGNPVERPPAFSLFYVALAGMLYAVNAFRDTLGLLGYVAVVMLMVGVPTLGIYAHHNRRLAFRPPD